MVSFFFALRPFPVSGVVALAAVTLYGAVIVASSPGELDSALGLLLFVQMFMASSGFLMAAHRGHFDPMLGYGRSRAAALAVQWGASVVPALVAWLALVLAGWVEGSAVVLSALAGRRLAAFFIVSAIAWSCGFALPRGAAGALWMGVLGWLLLRHPDLLSWAGPGTSALAVTRRAMSIVACPFLLIGGPSGIDAASVTAALAASCVLMLTVWRAGRWIDVYLVERA
ncbi:MAG TPA: hypothetical protein VGI12_07540 [Vicinamibacterales bacterium]|jgi:hypothetical protein